MQNDYFVHFFSPIGLDVISKQIVFVIDVSASMYGTKLSQTKEALKTMLDNLNPTDYFNIITFSDGVQYWRENNRLAPAQRRYIDDAMAYVDSLRDDSGKLILNSSEINYNYESSLKNNDIRYRMLRLCVRVQTLTSFWLS